MEKIFIIKDHETFFRDEMNTLYQKLESIRSIIRDTENTDKIQSIKDILGEN